jgi:hypothetical protein
MAGDDARQLQTEIEPLRKEAADLHATMRDVQTRIWDAMPGET